MHAVHFSKGIYLFFKVFFLKIPLFYTSIHPNHYKPDFFTRVLLYSRASHDFYTKAKQMEFTHPKALHQTTPSMANGTESLALSNAPQSSTREAPARG